MTAAKDDYEEQNHWTVVDDFRPGIYSHMRGVATAGTGLPAPLGAAQLNGTFKCIALSGGGLAPLPAITATFTIPLPDTDVNATFGYFNVNGFFAFGPVGPGPSGTVDDWFLGIEYVKTGGTNRVFTLYRVDPVTGTDPYPSDQLVQVTSTQNPTSEQYIGMTWTASRMNATDSTKPGMPVVVTAWAPPGFAADTHVWSFPDPSASGVTGVNDLVLNRPTTGGVINFGDIIGHQGRIIMLENNTNAFGARAGDLIPTNEQVSYSDPPNSFKAFGTSPNFYTIGLQRLVFEAEFPNGYGAFGSISDSELFLIKHQGGGVALYGPNPASYTIVRLPGVVSTGGFGCRAASTHQGLFYFTRYLGAWLWRGSDTATKISNNLEDGFMFYTPGPDKLLNFHTQFQEWGDWVVATNGYLYDTLEKGWWRLDDPASYTPHWYARGFFADNLYAVPLRATNAAGPGAKAGFIRQYNRTTPVNSYSWQSHPIAEAAPNRVIDVNNIILVAQGNGTVTISTSKYDNSTVPEVFTVSDTSQPQRLRLPTAVQNYNLVFKIVSTGTGGGAAPIVHSVGFGWREAELAVSV